MLSSTVSEDAATVKERDFLAALERRPSDDDTRAVLADWLEEQGRAEDAELVRVFLARKAKHAAASDVLACSRRLEELASSSSWNGRRSVLYDPSLRVRTQAVIDPDDVRRAQRATPVLRDRSGEGGLSPDPGPNGCDVTKRIDALHAVARGFECASKPEGATDVRSDEGVSFVDELANPG